uniref:Secreted protein n=1 Tax=Caenorhabditis tropicalis TaxID=1561998 RepID=A0A1I7TI61_9PELO
MQFRHLLIFLIFLLTIQFQVSTAMDSQHPAFTQNISPEHLPGSNMIGAGRGRRVQQAKSTQATQEANSQPQTHDQSGQQSTQK